MHSRETGAFFLRRKPSLGSLDSIAATVVIIGPVIVTSGIGGATVKWPTIKPDAEAAAVVMITTVIVMSVVMVRPLVAVMTMMPMTTATSQRHRAEQSHRGYCQGYNQFLHLFS
jgi:hypothetical protein